MKALGTGRRHDGRSLCLVGTGARVYHYRADGRLRDVRLGSALDLGLKEARTSVDRLRALRWQGIGSLTEKRTRVAARRLADGKAITFRQAAASCIAANRAGWRSPEHSAQRTATVATYAFPINADLPAGGVVTDHLVAILSPIPGTPGGRPVQIVWT